MYSVNHLLVPCYIIRPIGGRIERNIFRFHIQFSSGTVIQGAWGSVVVKALRY